MSCADLSELVGRIDTTADRVFALWPEGADLHYAWYGMSKAEAIAMLKHTITNIENGRSENLGPAPTQH